MKTALEDKSTLEEIRARFDADVERFSNLETGQQATIDAPLVLELVSQACARHLRAGDIRHSLASVKKAEQLLGYSRPVTLSQGLAIAMPWYVELFDKGRTSGGANDVALEAPAGGR